ncbi:hypothetical protein [Acinetobacter sp.]|uniref:hypothetical protein n=1 Tax=Acinetobacter sp. TaxID=472 RepID=UPI003750B504
MTKDQIEERLTLLQQTVSFLTDELKEIEEALKSGKLDARARKKETDRRLYIYQKAKFESAECKRLLDQIISHLE